MPPQGGGRSTSAPPTSKNAGAVPPPFEALLDINNGITAPRYHSHPATLVSIIISPQTIIPHAKSP
ncbi:hypothetical protein B0T16DRAFT_82064 [Cercophora newfieldiana]|uniref:Uncharacterized protein n=1 Tax=Cercophora newfieldiana TaxID=92897 RepID=A0AA40CWB1_9PEZI|nr:hypothetical protein B0T16DRAFT_82064 [Cercophora newfieldiana]